jgi:hypothetical protein
VAIKVPPIGTVVALWQSRSAQAVTEYKNGIQGAGGTWQAAVDDAEDNWSAGVNMAAGAHSFSRGVQGKAALYVTKAVEIGATRYGPGINAAGPQYNTGMGKVLAVIANITLPPRMPAGSNQGRSSAVSDALHQAKISGQI